MELQIILFHNKNRLAYSLWIFNVNYVAFDNIENKNTFYRGEDCMKKFCASLREHATNVINFEIATIKKKELKLHEDATECCICVKNY